MARFFINRPVFAWVIAILIMLAGGISIFRLPVSQYPSIAPPVVSLQVNYPGASAQTLEDTVTQVIEQKLNGIDGLLYMTSGSSSAGRMTMRLTFDSSVNPDTAQMQVQNKLQLAMPSLPDEVKRQGVTVNKVSDSFLQMFAFVSEDGSMSAVDLADFVASTIQDPLSRIDGVGAVSLYGAQYAMRIWLDPAKLYSYKMTPQDVADAISTQNVQLSVGQIGASPIVDGQQLNVTVNARKKLNTPEQFENILLRVNRDGSSVFLRDVARVEIGQENYTMSSRYNGQPAAGIGIQLASGANALQTAERVSAFLERMKPGFPAGVKVVSPYDTVPFVRISIQEVVKTLLEAIALVFVVMYLFLQNFRATIIPTIAVPIVLLGTFGVMAAFGFSINTLTMFGLVLAIGLLVDDAIVVVENVERVIQEEHLDPVTATEKSMDQISSSLIGIGVVLSAVFLPMAFMSGSTGVIYRQFSVTIVTAMTLSVLVALILTPSLCAGMLKQHSQSAQWGFFGWFNRMFTKNQHRYSSGVRRLVQRGGRIMLIYVLLLGGLSLIYKQLPTSFLPTEDQGAAIVMLQMPPNSTLAQTTAQFKEFSDYVLNEEKESADSVMVVAGYGMGGVAENTGMGFVKLKDYAERTKPGQDAASVAARIRQRFSGILDGQLIAAIPPAIISLGMTNGFTMELQDRGGVGHDKLRETGQKFLGAAFSNPVIAYVRPTGMDDITQFNIHLDNAKATSMGLTLSAVNADVSTYLGGAYVNDFVHNERVKKVFVKGDSDVRKQPEDLNRIKFRNDKGEMVPFNAIFSTNWSFGPAVLQRYNAMPTLEYQGEPKPGIASGIAMAAIEEEVKKLGKDFGMEWTGLSYQEKLSGSQTTMLYALSVLVVFLALAALYESWSIPFAVLLVIPLGILGAVAGTWLKGLTNDVYFQVGILAVMGLSSKNAILIVEFARNLQEEGRSLIDATVEACRIRLRPIIMTSLAFGLGVLPMMSASGAGAASQHAVGTAVFWGTVCATVLGIFFIPTFFVVVCGSTRWVGDRLKKKLRKL